jgi:L-seryl-tRNA(Ser) seleniumtransferase
VHSAPHHGYARSMKVGREEMIAMLVAIESWVKSDHDAIWKTWIARCQHIADRVSKIPGVTAVVRREPGASLSNRSPSVQVRWNSKQLGLTGQDLTNILDTTEPRIKLGGGGGGGGQQGQAPAGDTGVSMVASTMAPGDERVVANRLYEVLTAKHTLTPVEPPAAPAVDLSGVWDVQIAYTASTTTHALQLVQHGARVMGVHQGNFQSRDISGSVNGSAVTLASVVTERHGDSLNYRFTGNAVGDTMSGTLDLGEYLGATWTAKRRKAGT